jgi:hypothetical protein
MSVVATFPAPVQTGPAAQPALCTSIMGTRSLSRGKAAAAWPSPPTFSRAEVEETVEMYLYSPSVPSRHVIG